MTAAQGLVVTQSSVRRGGQVIARLRWSGRVVTVVRDGNALGRLLPAGYLQGAPDDGSGRYDAWTARHPAVHTPSDTVIAGNLTMADAVGLLLGRDGRR